MGIQAAVKSNSEEDIYEILDHAEQEIKKVMWAVTGWWKAARTSDDASYVTPKGHIVAMRCVGELQK